MWNDKINDKRLKTFPVNESVLQSPIAGPTVAAAVALVVVSGPAMEND